MKKKHFYEGMTPLPSDFDALQQNTEDAVRGTAHAITGTGVLAGLEIEEHKGLHLSIDTAHNNKFTIAEGRLVGNKLYFSDNKKITIQVPLAETDIISKVYVGSIGIGGDHTLYVSGWEIKAYLDKTLLVAGTNGSGFSVSDDAFEGFDVTSSVSGKQVGHKLLTLEIVYQQPTSNNIYMTVGDVVVTIAGATGHHIGPGVAIAPSGQRLALLTGQVVTGSDGLVVLRYTQTPLDATKDYATNIKQERVWLNTYDVITAEMVSHDKRLPDDVVLGELKGGAVDLSRREIATGWDTLVTLQQQMHHELNTKITQLKTDLTNAVTQAKQEARHDAYRARTDASNAVALARTDASNAVAQARTDASNAINTAKAQAIDAALPVGFIYIQFPAQKEPSQLGWPGKWTNISRTYAGCFFRAEGNGTVAKPFTTTAHVNESNSHGPQKDAGREVEGIIRVPIGIKKVYLTGPFVLEMPGGVPTTHDPTVDTPRGGPAIASRNVVFQASRVWTAAHTANEFRPLNYTVRIWKRTA